MAAAAETASWTDGMLGGGGGLGGLGSNGVCSLSSNPLLCKWETLGSSGSPELAGKCTGTSDGTWHARARWLAAATPLRLTSARRPPSPSPPGWGRAATARDGAPRPDAPGRAAPAAAAPAGPAPRRRTRGPRRSGAGAAGGEQVSRTAQSAGAGAEAEARRAAPGLRASPAPRGPCEPPPHLF